MALITFQAVTLAFGAASLFDQVNLQIEPNERVCILGRNGTGKSTLLKLLAGELLPDEGEIQRKSGLRVAALAQEVPRRLTGSILQVVVDLAADKADKRKAGGAGNQEGDVDSQTRWDLEQRAQETLSRMNLDPSLKFESLSAGMKRRVLLACALVQAPDILLLDEPTNHLDLAAITWMEDFLTRYPKTIVFVTHDRALLRKLATRVVEIDRGNLYSFGCDYETYIQRRQADLEAEENKWRVFDKKLAQEEAWIRQGIKARRTRNEGRVRALLKLREERRARRAKIGSAQLNIQTAEKSGKLVIESRNLSLSFGAVPIVQDFSVTIIRGDKIGLIGPNGVGKTTLIKLLLQEATPQSGSVRHGTRLQVAYFDQLRQHLDEEKSVQQNIADGNDTIVFNGRQRHVIGYLQDFLFSPERARSPMHVLSGGEKNRLLLAKLFTQPFNLLVMDEPTNDLDLETLELLEELLFEFSGTLLLVSHDREFLNRVVTSTLVFEGNGKVSEYAGGYDDYLLQRPKASKPTPAAAKKSPSPGNDKSGKAPRKLGYMQQRELEQLPQQIDALEKEQQKLYEMLSDPELYRNEKEDIADLQKALAQVEVDIKKAYERWEELESFSEGG